MTCVYENEKSLIGFKTSAGSIVIKYNPSINRKNRWTLECNSCGTHYNATGVGLVKNMAILCKSCRAISSDKQNLIGQTFGRWTVIKSSQMQTNKSNRNRHYLCVCSCKNKTERVVKSASLFSGRSKSCGCLKIEKLRTGRQDDPLRDRHKAIRKSITKYIFKRDNYKCLICNSSKKINAHHINGWSWAISERFEETNLATLCGRCHNDFHSKYGRGKNTKEQFENYTKQLSLILSEIICSYEQYKSINNFKEEFIKAHQYYPTT